MAHYNLADHYKAAGLHIAPNDVGLRQAPADRIRAKKDSSQVLDLITAYYGMSGDLSWFRDEFSKEDPSFSLVDNAREVAVLAAAILSDKCADGDSVSILGLLTCSAGGKRKPIEAGGVLNDAKQLFLDLAAKRKSSRPDVTPVKFSDAKLGEVAAAIPQNDWAAMRDILTRIHDEGRTNQKGIADRLTKAASALDTELRRLREETEMLWWLFGQYSSTLQKPYSDLRQSTAAIFSGLELAERTTFSQLGPVAATALLQRIVSLAQKSKRASEPLSTIVDEIGADLPKVQANLSDKHPHVFPIMYALKRAAEIGVGSWGPTFEKTIKLPVATAYDPQTIADQIYREHLLGQVL